ncbi:hypothetical protein BZK32_17525 [Escherichia coli]|nr:hypothetical protein BZK32_17525 [Escherichia coli]
MSFSRARRTGSAYFTDGEKPVSETQLKQKDFQYVFTGRGTRIQSCRAPTIRLPGHGHRDWRDSAKVRNCWRQW